MLSVIITIFVIPMIGLKALSGYLIASYSFSTIVQAFSRSSNFLLKSLINRSDWLSTPGTASSETSHSRVNISPSTGMANF